MNTIIIVPTGVGAEIGGHNGDANPVAKLFGALSDHVIVHPNVVNASDINEMPENALYVDGLMLDEFLAGQIDLKPSLNRHILLVTNAPVLNATINAVSAARVTLGIDVRILELKTPLQMTAHYDSDGTASGVVNGWEELVEQVKEYDFDALAITTPVTVDDEVAKEYLANGGVNPWGGVEAIATRRISNMIRKPVAHSPTTTESLKFYDEVVDPRMAPELLSNTFLHSVFKGLHRAPQIGSGLSVTDFDFLISPEGCYWTPHILAAQNGVHVILVRENKTVLDAHPEVDQDGLYTVCENYLDAAGIVACKKAGIIPESVRRPLGPTIIERAS